MIPESKRRVAYINEMIESGHAAELVKEGEDYHAEQLASIARNICSRAGVRVVLIAGPSSSGKTSTSHRLCLELLAQGKEPVALSLDNWYVDGSLTPVKEDGSKDYESVYAIDLAQLESDLKALIAGQEIALPTFNFAEERREYLGETLQMAPDAVLVIEGIHALNPILHKNIPAEDKHLIYASALTSLRIDDETRISTSENRLIRRLCRDYTTRGVSGESTLLRWQSVRRGEEKWIFPFQENADVFFNTTLIYELAALQPKAVHILREVPFDSPARPEAERLLNFLSYFSPISEINIPNDSIIREFIGGSVFNVG